MTVFKQTFPLHLTINQKRVLWIGLLTTGLFCISQKLKLGVSKLEFRSHSYATHPMEQDVKIYYIQYIQSSLGHSSTKTTEIYTRVVGINSKTLKSPLDSLYESGTFEKEKPK